MREDGEFSICRPQYNIEHIKKMRMLLRKINTRLLIKFPR